VKSPGLLALPAATFIVAAAFLAALFAVSRPSASPPANGPPPGPYKGSEPPGAIRAPAFSLRDYRGRLVSIRAQRGKVVVLSFVDSKCTEKCPIVTSVIAQAYRRLAPSARRQVVPILISVSPKVDTPKSVRRFLTARHALALAYLSGAPRRLRPVWKAYGILSALETGNADVHSSDVRVFDRRGIWVSTQHAGIDLSPGNLEHDVLRALKRNHS
jgi:cytochrome oxidase Cu insertion factor (SCO1/SenC/PrrC family)